MSQGRPALAFEVRRASPSESPQALAERALALVAAGADMLVVRMFSARTQPLSCTLRARISQSSHQQQPRKPLQRGWCCG